MGGFINYGGVIEYACGGHRRPLNIVQGGLKIELSFGCGAFVLLTFWVCLPS